MYTKARDRLGLDFGMDRSVVLELLLSRAIRSEESGRPLSAARFFVSAASRIVNGKAAVRGNLVWAKELASRAEALLDQLDAVQATGMPDFRSYERAIRRNIAYVNAKADRIIRSGLPELRG
jgi:hypothetical protein